MKIIDLDIKSCPDITTVGLGNFDGLHMGHQALVSEVISLSKKTKTKSALVLFKTHSRFTKTKFFLTSLEDKIRIISSMGIDYGLIVDFSSSFKSLKEEEFIASFLKEKCKARGIVIGPDYRFAYGARGSASSLNFYKDKYGYDLKVIDKVIFNGKLVSSTDIKKLIKSGQIQSANKLLARDYSIRGRVVKGYGRGRDLGYPTANIKPSFPYLIPLEGVYHTYVLYKDHIYNSMTSIGDNPTFEDPRHRQTIEVFIDKFNHNIYGEEIVLIFSKYLRPMIKFESVDDLKNKLNEDYGHIKALDFVYKK